MEPHISAAKNFVQEALKISSKAKSSPTFAPMVPFNQFFEHLEPPKEGNEILDRIKHNSSTFLTNYIIILCGFQLFALLIKPPAIMFLFFLSLTLFWGFILYQMYKANPNLVKDAIALICIISTILMLFTFTNREYFETLIYLELIPLVLCVVHMLLRAPTNTNTMGFETSFGIHTAQE